MKRLAGDVSSEPRISPFWRASYSQPCTLCTLCWNISSLRSIVNAVVAEPLFFCGLHLDRILNAGKVEIFAAILDIFSVLNLLHNDHITFELSGKE